MSYDEHLISMAGGDGGVLDAIQRRVDRAHEGWKLETKDQANSDRETLLAMVREQRAVIERAKGLADSFDELASQSSYFGTEDQMETWLSAANRVRAALTATELTK